MHLGLLIYGSIDTLSGGYLYDRRLVESLRAMGDRVEIIGLPWRNYLRHLADNLSFRLPRGLDLLIQDELNHPSLIAANTRLHPCPVISLVHHLRASELRPAWQNALYRSVERRYLQGVDGFIFNSQTTREAVTSLTRQDKPSIIVYPPTDRFGVGVTEADIIQRAGSRELRVLFLGNVIERKGLHTLLEAIRLQTSDVRVEVVGSLNPEARYAQKMQVLAGEQGLNVRFLGPLDNESLIQRLREAHVLAVPSSYEGFGIVYLEGMGFGLPAIGTTAGAAREIITDGMDGFLLRAGDAFSLADRLRRLNEDRAGLIRMSLAARERFLREPSWEQSAGSARRFLEEMVRGKRTEHEAHEGEPGNS